MFLPASATVEASLVIPLYIYAVLAVAYVIQIIGIKSTMYKAMYNSTRQLAAYAYAVERTERFSGAAAKKAVTSALAKQYLLSSLPGEYISQNRISRGQSGIRVYAGFSEQLNNEISIKVSYQLNNPFDVFGIGTVDITQQCSSAAWLGQTSGEDFADTDSSKERVYITEQGTVYHKSRQCTYLNPSIRQITQEQLDTARNSFGAKYYLCERCGKRSGSGIYITDYGEKYHYDKNCSGLKRSIFSVPLSEVQDKGACSKCAGYNSG